VEPTNTPLSAEGADVILVLQLTPEVRRLCELCTLMRAAKRDTRALAERREELVIGTSADMRVSCRVDSERSIPRFGNDLDDLQGSGHSDILGIQVDLQPEVRIQNPALLALRDPSRLVK
jgi:hypothetical protein